MSLPRQIKALATLSLQLVIFSVWIAINSLLFKLQADFRLFLVTLASVFFMKVIFNFKISKYLSVFLTILINLIVLWSLFDRSYISVNLVLIIASMFINIKREKLSVDYENYKLKAKQGTIILAVVALMSLWLDKTSADYIYRLFANYIIVTVVLLRETRAYFYKVTTEDSSSKKDGVYHSIESFLKNIILRYGAVIFVTIVFSTDWIIRKSVGVIDKFSILANYIINAFLDLIRILIGPILISIINKLSNVFGNRSFILALEDLKRSLSNFTKNVDLVNGGATAADERLLYSTLKGVALLIIILFIADAVYKVKFLKHKSESYIEEKEKLYKNIGDQLGRMDKEKILSLFKKVLKGNKTLRDKILYTYREFEKVTYKALIFKPYMTAEELRDSIKPKLSNEAYIDEMTEIYNKVKFSNYEPIDAQLEIMKKAFNNTKEQL